MPRISNYVRIPAHPALLKHIVHYSISFPLQGPILSGSLSLVPDASGSIVCTCLGGRIEQLLWGPSSRLVTVANDVNRIPLRLFVELRPGALSPLFRGMSADVLRDCVVPLESIDQELSFALGRTLERSFSIRPGNPSSSVQGRDLFCKVLADELDALFLRRFANPETDKQLLIRYITSKIAQSHGCLRASEVARLTGYSERYLHQLSSQSLGLSLKPLARIFRINEACARLKRNRGSLTALAVELGYHDQAHFIHEFKTVCGTTPTMYLRNASEFYNEFSKLTL